MINIVVIMPTYNRPEKTERALRQLLQSDLNKFTFQVIVVDASSSLDTKILISNYFPLVDRLTVSQSSFWTASINQGISYALRNIEFEFLLIMNQDCYVDQFFLSPLIKTARTIKNSIVSPLVLGQYSKLIRFGPAIWSTWKLGWHYTYSGQHEDILASETLEVPLLNGNCVLFRKSNFENSLFDEINLPHCYADAAFTIQAKRDGQLLLMNCASVVYDDETDVIERERGPELPTNLLLKRVFYDTKSAYFLKAIITFYYNYSPSKLTGLFVLITRLFRMCARIIVSQLGFKRFYNE